MPALEVSHLSVAYGDRVVLDDVQAQFFKGKMTAIVGPNGAGKSTLIKAALGLIPRISGEVQVFGRPYRPGDLQVAYLPQRESVDWDFPVRVIDVVLMGTYGQLGWFRKPGKREWAAAEQAVDTVGLNGLQQRQISQLSGGQQQRVFLARALAQEAEILVMDEPFAGVDAVTEEAISLVLRAQLSQGKTVIAVHHDLETVREIFDEVLLLNRRVVAQGALPEALSDEVLKRAYRARSAEACP